MFMVSVTQKFSNFASFDGESKRSEVIRTTAYTVILEDMTDKDLLSPLLAGENLAESAQRAAEAIAKVHRRPAGLRKPDVISSESLLRGARASVALDGGEFPRDSAGTSGLVGAAAHAVSVYALLAPERLATSARTFQRAPLQVLARMDVAAGGTGTPAGDAARVQRLASLIVAPEAQRGVAFDRLLPVVVHAEIAAGGLFGPRSGVVARAAARLAAVVTGFDPRGFAVPETYFNRHRQPYLKLLAEYAAGRADGLIAQHFAAWEAGAAEADGIARAV